MAGVRLKANVPEDLSVLIITICFVGFSYSFNVYIIVELVLDSASGSYAYIFPADAKQIVRIIKKRNMCACTLFLAFI